MTATEFLVPVLLLASWGTAFAEDAVVHRGGQPDVVRMPLGDARLNEAIALARHSVEEFIAALAAAGTKQRSFAVEVPVIEGAHVEQFWVDVESFGNGQFTGRIANEPLEVDGVKRGDRIVVDKERISDWMYVDRGHLVGGFTIRLMRAALGAADRAAFDASLPFEIGEP